MMGSPVSPSEPWAFVLASYIAIAVRIGRTLWLTVVLTQLHEDLAVVVSTPWIAFCFEARKVSRRFGRRRLEAGWRAIGRFAIGYWVAIITQRKRQTKRYLQEGRGKTARASSAETATVGRRSAMGFEPVLAGTRMRCLTLQPTYA